jgi:Membrane protein involved in the export of O-antigen and teichoic acid
MIDKLKTFLKRFPRHWVVAASAWGSRIVSASIQIISIRVLLTYLGEERYAVYVIAYSLSAWFSLCDCGIGMALQNFISESRAKNQSYDKYLKSTLQLITVLFFIFAVILFFVSPIAQNKLFEKFDSILELQKINLIAIIGCILIATALVNIVYRVYYALQKGYVSNILPAFSMIISMIAIVLLNRYYPVRGSILAALIVFTIPQLIVAFFPFIKIFKKFFSGIFIADSETLKKLALRSAKFWGFAIMSAATLQIDYIIMSQTVSPEGITTYNIFNRFFLLILFIHSAVLAAAWPLCTELFNKGSYGQIKSMIMKYTLFGIGITISGALLIFIFSDFIIKTLAPETSLNPPNIIFILFGVYFLLRVWSDTFAMFLQSINALRIFWIYIPFQAIISISAQYFLSLKYGITGILAGLILSFAITAAIVLPYKTWKVFKSKENINAV